MAVLLPIFIFAVWSFWILTIILSRAAKGDFGGTSIFPGIPVFPLFAWSVAVTLNRFQAGLGTTVVGGFHLVLLLVYIVSAACSVYVLHQRGYWNKADAGHTRSSASDR